MVWVFKLAGDAGRATHPRSQQPPHRLIRPQPTSSSSTISPTTKCPKTPKVDHYIFTHPAHFAPPLEHTHTHYEVCSTLFCPNHHVDSDDAWNVTIPTCSPAAFWCSCSVLWSFWWNLCFGENPPRPGSAMSLRTRVPPLRRENDQKLWN